MTVSESRHEDMTSERLEDMQKEYRLKVAASKIPNFIIPTAQERAYLDGKLQNYDVGKTN